MLETIFTKGAPILSKDNGKVIGVVEFVKLSSSSFSDVDVRMAEMLCRHMSIFIEKFTDA